MERDRLHQPVAFVEDSDDRGSLRHGGYPGLASGQHLSAVRGLLLRLVRGLRAAGGKRQRKNESAVAEHVYSGVQGW
jgi:hypothetical protein